MVIGEQIVRLRHARGLTQEELAHRAGLSVDVIRRLEQGQRSTARLETLEKIAKGLDADASVVFAARGQAASEAASREAAKAEHSTDAGPRALSPPDPATPQPRHPGRVMARRIVVDPNFGARLRELREQCRFSLRRLGREVHCSHGYLWDLESGGKRPSAAVAALLDAALGAGGQLSALVSEVSADSAELPATGNGAAG